MSIFWRYAVFFGVVLGLTALTHTLVHHRLSSALGLPSRASFGFGWLLGLGAMSMIAAAVLSRSPHPAFALRALIWFGYCWMGVFLLLLTTSAALDLVRLVLWMLVKIWPEFTVAARALPCLAMTLVSASLIASVWAVRQALSPPRIYEINVPIAGLPAAFDGYRIAHLTDTHIGPILGRAWVQRLVDRIDSAKPDLVVHTGDLVDGRVDALRQDVQPLAALKGADGSYFVTGNHESYSGPREWADHMRELGFDVLLNEHRVLKRGSDSIVLAGVTDQNEGQFLPDRRCDPVKALEGAPGGVRILLAHQPRTAFLAQGLGVSLQLSGHTHGGQLWPFHYLVRLQQPVVSGFAEVAHVPVFVSNGAGFWGPPMRLFAPPEVPILVLRRG